MSDQLDIMDVAIVSDEGYSYNTTAPYHPSLLYAEYPFSQEHIARLPVPGKDAYGAIREAFRALGYDPSRIGTKEWNPLGHLIKPGDNVVLKPNFVRHWNGNGLDLFASLTHPSVIRAVGDFVCIALQGKGTLTVVEAPQMDCDFDVVRRELHLDEISSFYHEIAGREVRFLDVRRLRCTWDIEKGFYPASSFVVNENADPAGYTLFDIGKESMLEGLTGLENLYGSDYDRTFTVQNHRPGVHRYLVANSILNADVVICLPKMKTHKKVGVTLNLKLLVGINGDKNYLAHYRVGSPSDHGDEFPDVRLGLRKLDRKIIRFLQDSLVTRRNRLSDGLWGLARGVRKFLKLFFRRTGPVGHGDSYAVWGGNWRGNDTAWRMAIDLATILLYGGRNGKLSDRAQRRTLSIVDGITGGEKDGPMEASPLHAGTIVVGENILAVDTAVATLMGFDFRKIKMISEAWLRLRFRMARTSPETIIIRSTDPSLHGSTAESCRKFSFAPHHNWTGAIELTPNTDSLASTAA